MKFNSVSFFKFLTPLWPKARLLTNSSMNKLNLSIEVYHSARTERSRWKNVWGKSKGNFTTLVKDRNCINYLLSLHFLQWKSIRALCAWTSVCILYVFNKHHEVWIGLDKNLPNIQLPIFTTVWCNCDLEMQSRSLTLRGTNG